MKTIYYEAYRTKTPRITSVRIGCYYRHKPLIIDAMNVHTIGVDVLFGESIYKEAARIALNCANNIFNEDDIFRIMPKPEHYIV